jgi:thiamine-phosphate pyrophosphorylase
MPRRQRLSPTVPSLWLLSDERVATASLIRAAGRLPRGSGIILRHHATPAAERKRLFGTLRRIADRRGLFLLLAGDPAAAGAWEADGYHGWHDQRRSPAKIRSAPVHDMPQLRRAERQGADLVFISPLFATRSHPGKRPLGPVRFAALASRAHVPVIALGGVARRHARLIHMLGASGYGAIDSLTDRKQRTKIRT